jgi:hypothetical protein
VDGMTEETGIVEEEDFLKVVRERYRLCVEADRENRDRAKEALDFRDLEQWDDRTKNERQNDPEGARPCLVVDKLNQHVMQVVNDERQNRPQIKVRPIDDKGDVEVAKIYDGILRHIQDRSRADVAYDTAFECAVDGGFGFWRLLTEYTDPMSFDQDIVIQRIRNRFSVYLDPERQQPDGSDAKYGFILYKVQKKDFKNEFGKDGEDAIESFRFDGKEFVEWYGEDWVIYAEYFWKERKEITIVMTEDGVMTKEESGERPILAERKTAITKIRWRKVTATKILEDGKWIGDNIPIVEVIGTEIDIEGKVNRSGLIRSAMDAQRVDNYATSAFVENVALAPRASYVAAVGQLEGNEELWRTANRRNISVLPYKPITVDGTLAPPPRREAPPGISAGWLSVLEQSEHNIQASMGRYNATLGAPSNETSGRAIQARNREGDTGSYHFTDNLHRSQKHTGQMIVNIIPKIYDTKRIARIIGEDGELGQATVDPNLQDAKGNPIPYAEQQGPNGLEKIYNLGVGKYDVTIVPGPSYTTRRLESADAMMEISRSNKEFMGNFGDIIFKAQDWPGADKISERFKKMLPPELKEDETDVEKQKANLQQAAQMLGQKEAEVNAAIEQIQEQGQSVAEQEEKAKDALDRVEKEINKLNEIKQGIETEKRELLLNKKLADEQLDSKQLAQKYAMLEVVYKVEKMLSDHQKEVEDALETNKSNGSEESSNPELVSAIIASTQQTTEAIRQILETLTAPRETQLITDEQGNPTGSVSRLM